MRTRTLPVVATLRQSPTLRRVPLVVYAAMEAGNEDRPRLCPGPREFLTNSRCRLTEVEGCVVRLLNTITGETMQRSMLGEQTPATGGESGRQAAILNALPANIAVLGPRGEILTVNESWRQFGRANALRTSEFGIGSNYLDTCDRATGNDGEEAFAVAAGIRSVLRGTERFSIEYPCHSPAEQRWFRLTVTPMPLDRATGAVVMHTAVTERKRAEEALRESYEGSERRERILTTMLSSISDFAYIFDRDGRFLFVNQPLLSLWGIPLDAAVGKDFFDLQYPDDLATTLQREIQEVIATKASLTGETPYTSPDGLDGFYEYIFSPAFAADGTVEFVAGSTRDVTERKRMEAALFEEKERAQLTLNCIGDAVACTDTSGDVTFMNLAAETLTGWPLAEAVGRPMADVFQVVDVATGAATAGLHAVSGKLDADATSPSNTVLVRRDAIKIPIEGSVAPIHDRDGQATGSVAVFRDVTERRAVERLKSEFVSTVSHELRTPLTSIRGALGLLGSGLLGPIEEKGKRMLEIAVTNTDRLVRLINDILDLERIGSGNIELSRGAVDAHTVMLQASEGVQSVADQAGVRLVVEPGTGALWGDSDRIIQTLTNLIGNAIKFSPPQTTVTISGTTPGTNFDFCIADQGRGIPEGKLKTIFERFSQVDSSDSRDKGGSGLGLAICKSIVSAHGGRIWVEPNPPAGSRFHFTIPLASSVIRNPAAASPESVASETADDLAAIKTASDAPAILLVEDDADLARVMTTLLHSRGIQTFHAITGSDAILLSKQHPPSLIVLDLGLPDMDGFSVVATLRESPALRRVPLIVYSAMEVGNEDRPRLCLGPTEFLTKSRCSLTEFEEHAIRLMEAVTNYKREDGQNAA